MFFKTCNVAWVLLIVVGRTVTYSCLLRPSFDLRSSVDNHTSSSFFYVKTCITQFSFISQLYSWTIVHLALNNMHSLTHFINVCMNIPFKSWQQQDQLNVWCFLFYGRKKNDWFIQLQSWNHHIQHAMMNQLKPLPLPSHSHVDVTAMHL